MLLAMKLGWSRAEIMALSLAESEYYITQLTELNPTEP
jgi:hypothetical protein